MINHKYIQESLSLGFNYAVSQNVVKGFKKKKDNRLLLTEMLLKHLRRKQRGLRYKFHYHKISDSQE